MNNHNDIERINRVNFRSSLEALARPGLIQDVRPLFASTLQAMASVLLYSEVSYCYHGDEDFQMIQAICGAKVASADEADYLFCDHPEIDFLVPAKVGTAEKPELGATLICKYDAQKSVKTPVRLSGPGIETTVQAALPVGSGFIKQLKEKNAAFPMGVEVFFINDHGQLLGLPRTTHIEVAS